MYSVLGGRQDREFGQVQNMKKYLPNIVKQVFYLACREGLTLYRPAGGA